MKVTVILLCDCGVEEAADLLKLLTVAAAFLGLLVLLTELFV